MRVLKLRKHGDVDGISSPGGCLRVDSTDDFLLDQLDLHPEDTLQIVGEIINDMKNPKMTFNEYVEPLYTRMNLPLFSTELNRLGTS